MSCLYKIEQSQSAFTDTEKKIAEYLIQNKNEVVNYSAQILAGKTKSSAAAIIRFSKKLGYKGFMSLKVELAKDLGDNDELFDIIIKNKDSMETLIQKSYNLNVQNLKETYRMITEKNLVEAVDCILHSEKIYLYGSGGSGIVCRDFMHKLSRINKTVVYQEDFHMQLTQTAFISEKDVAIAISYGGNTKEVNVAMKHAKKNGTKTIGITKNAKTILSKIIDIPLFIPIEEKEIRLGAISSRFSSLMVTDLLYLAIAKDNFDVTKSDIIKTRKLINEIE